MQHNLQKKNFFNRLLGLASIGMLMMAAVILIKYQLDINEQYHNSDIALNDVKQVMKEKTDFRAEPPQVGAPIGTIKLGSHSKNLPIIEGEDIQLSMSRGVGRIPFGSMPGSDYKKQVLLSAHRETFFLNLKDLKKGEIVTIKMPYRTFRYQVSDMKVVKENEADKVYKNGELESEELVLITCYPFNAFSKPDRRYIVTAYPV